VHLWDARSGERLQGSLKYSGELTGALFSPDGRHVVTFCGSNPALAGPGEQPVGETRVWEVATGQPVSPPLKHGATPFSGTFSPDGLRLLTTCQLSDRAGGFTFEAREWDAGTGQPLTPVLRWSPGQGTILTVAYSGRQLAAAYGPEVWVWDLTPDRQPQEDWELLARLLSGYRVDASGSAVPLDAAQLGDAWDKLRAKYPAFFRGPPEERLAWHRSEVERCEVHGENWAAGWHLDRLMEADPPQEALVLRRAQLYERFDQWNQAVEVYSRALKALPASRIVRLGRARAYQQMNRLDKAVEDYGEMIKLDPRDAEAHFLRGEVYRVSGSLDKAIADLSEALKLNPNNAWAWGGRGAAHATRGDLDKAFADFNEGIRLVPNYAFALAGRGDVYLRQGAYDKAVADLSKAIGINRNYTWAYQTRGAAYAHLGQWDKAAADLATVTVQAPSFAYGWYQRALLSLQAGNAAGYQQTCAAVLTRFGKSTDANVLVTAARACVLAPGAVKDPQQFVQVAQQAVTAKPKGAYWVGTLGAALYRAGQFDAALKRLNEALALDGKGGSAADWLFLAMTHQRLGQPDEARKWLDKAVGWIEQAAKDKPKEGPPGQALPWDRKAELQLLRREAEALIKGAK
jgi:tetratricopeptide (TPR) repeat protein